VIVAGADKQPPRGPDGKPGRAPGYPEPQPRDREDAHRPQRKPPPPDEGGLDRKPAPSPDPAED